VRETDSACVWQNPHPPLAGVTGARMAGIERMFPLAPARFSGGMETTGMMFPLAPARCHTAQANTGAIAC
jgi:hypothetical protein